MPSIRKMGAAISKAIMPRTNGRSVLDSFSPRWRLPMDMIPIPIPAPRYRSAAMVVGPTWFSSSFDKGTLTA